MEYNDRIVYKLVTEPGGVDGMDHNDKGGNVMAAAFDINIIKKMKGVDSRYRIEKEIVEINSAKNKALRKLSAIDRLLLGV